MEYILRGILTLLTTGISQLAGLIGGSVLELLTIDIGTSGSVFDIVFSSFLPIAEVLQALALAFLMLSFMWQLFVIMSTPDGGQQTPLSLIVSTLIAGFGIYAAPTIIRIAESFFNGVYETLLNIGIASVDVAGSIAPTFEEIPNFLLSAASLFNPVTGAITGTVSIGALLLCLIIILFLVYQFFMYLIEIVERYVLLGVLYYTSPLAFSMAASKSTRNVFNSWVRMVGSQLFLMLCNVIFLKLFLQGLLNYGSNVRTIVNQNSSGFLEFPVMIVYFLILYGILYVGTRVDTYLSTLGLSAAQTGRGMAAALVATGLGVRRAIDAGVGLGKTASGIVGKTGAGNQLHNTMAGVKSGFKEGFRKAGIGGVAATFDSKTGFITADTLVTSVNRGGINKRYERALNGIGAAMTFKKAVGTQLPSKILDNMDLTSFSIGSDGTMKFSTRREKQGDPPLNVTLVPITGNNAKKITPDMPGNAITITGENGEKAGLYWQVSGGKEGQAAKLNAFNPAMKEAEEHYNDKGYEVKHHAPGLFTAVKKDANGDIQEAIQVTSPSLYRPDTTKGSSFLKTASGEVYTTDITDVAKGKVYAEGFEIGENAGAAQLPNPVDKFSTAFPQEVLNDGAAVELTTLYDGEKHKLHGAFATHDEKNSATTYYAPVNTCAVRPGFENSMSYVTANNGAQYVKITVDSKTAPGDVLIARDNAQEDKGSKVSYVGVAPYVKDIEKGDINKCQPQPVLVREAYADQNTRNKKR